MPTTQLAFSNAARYVPGVSVYFPDRPMRSSVPIAEALAFAADPRVLILGAMRPGYLGREVVTADDLTHWVAEDDSAAEWAYITAAEQYAAENGLLR